MKAFHPFARRPDQAELPQRFTFPFRYEPHPLCLLAAREVQSYLSVRTEWAEELDAGKMFGVLVVQKDGRTGFLAAYSGILNGRNDHAYFVPPVYDLLQPDGFFKTEEERISDLNRRIGELEHDETRHALQNELAALERERDEQLSAMREQMKHDKRRRDALRTQLNDPAQLDALVRESQHQRAEYKREEQRWRLRTDDIRTALERIHTSVRQLKEERRQRSAQLQQQIFGRFMMRNARGETKDLCSIFQEYRRSLPPAGAGECAAPKLLQYAYAHGCRPLAMAEFWWGRSPATELRRHGCFYPACKSKCEPILMFMLQGLEVEPNPMTETARRCNEPEIVYEDRWMVAVNKPAGMYSVPGRDDVKSVYSWAREHYPEADGPLVVHRLDMDTSGLLLIAKTKTAHEQLQKLFESRCIRKTYIAILDGTTDADEGVISLPLRPDLSDRPRQTVCRTAGKPAVTRFRVLERQNGQTRVAFFPHTGRTHQLRVHAAHPEGLNAPIVGDALYGTLADRLCLHAETLEFRHFATGELLRLSVPAPF